MVECSYFVVILKVINTGLHKVCQGFGQANFVKLGNGGLVLGLGDFLLLPLMPQKIAA